MAWIETIVGSAIGATIPSAVALAIWLDQRRRDETRAKSSRVEQIQVFNDLADDLRELARDRESYDAAAEFCREMFALRLAAYRCDILEKNRLFVVSSLASERLLRYADLTPSQRDEFREKFLRFCTLTNSMVSSRDRPEELESAYNAAHTEIVNLAINMVELG